MRKTKMPGRGGDASRAGHNERSSKMSEKYCITWPTRRQWRRAVVWLIEAAIGTGFVAGTIWLAAVLLKACGVL